MLVTITVMRAAEKRQITGETGRLDQQKLTWTCSLLGCQTRSLRVATREKRPFRLHWQYL